MHGEQPSHSTVRASTASIGTYPQHQSIFRVISCSWLQRPRTGHSWNPSSWNDRTERTAIMRRTWEFGENVGEWKKKKSIPGLIHPNSPSRSSVLGEQSHSRIQQRMVVDKAEECRCRGVGEETEEVVKRGRDAWTQRADQSRSPQSAIAGSPLHHDDPHSLFIGTSHTLLPPVSSSSSHQRRQTLSPIACSQHVQVSLQTESTLSLMYTQPLGSTHSNSSSSHRRTSHTQAHTKEASLTFGVSETSLEVGKRRRRDCPIPYLLAHRHSSLGAALAAERENRIFTTRVRGSDRRCRAEPGGLRCPARRTSLSLATEMDQLLQDKRSAVSRRGHHNMAEDQGSSRGGREGSRGG
jgi:hypothetical protein